MPVRVDDDGLVSLTDMWRARGSKDDEKPKDFLKSKQTKAFLSVLETKGTIIPLRTFRGGNDAGTWAHKLVAYKFAAWIDPEFEYGVYTVLDGYFNKELVINPQQKLHDHVLKVKTSEAIASLHGKGLNQRRWEKQELEQEGLKLLQEYQQQFNFTPQALLPH